MIEDIKNSKMLETALTLPNSKINRYIKQLTDHPILNYMKEDVDVETVRFTLELFHKLYRNPQDEPYDPALAIRRFNLNWEFEKGKTSFIDFYYVCFAVTMGITKPAPTNLKSVLPLVFLFADIYDIVKDLALSMLPKGFR